MRKLLIIFVCFYSFSAFSQILVDEGWAATSRGRIRSELGGSLKAHKKIGIQGTLAGATGLAGINLDINFAEDFAFSFGMGISRGFQSFNTHIKRSLSNGNIAPYFVAGYSRWYAGEGNGKVEQTSPPVVAKKFLSAKELATGEFSKNVIYPGLGIQYLVLNGDWEGFGVFAEALLLVDVDDMVTGGTGAIGSIYYF